MTNPKPPRIKMRFEVCHRVVPYVRMTRKSKFVNPSAQRYLTSQEHIAWQVKTIMTTRGWQMIEKTSLAVYIRQTVAGDPHYCDADNTIKAILDAVKGIVWNDDRWVDSITFVRVSGKQDQFMLMVYQVED